MFCVPRLEKVVINIGMGEAITNAKAMEAAERDLVAICGQHPSDYPFQEVYCCLN